MPLKILEQNDIDKMLGINENQKVFVFNNTRISIINKEYLKINNDDASGKLKERFDDFNSKPK